MFRNFVKRSRRFRCLGVGEEERNMRWSSEWLEASTCVINQTARCLSTSPAAMIRTSLQAWPLAKHCTARPGAELIGKVPTSIISELKPRQEADQESCNTSQLPGLAQRLHCLCLLSQRPLNNNAAFLCSWNRFSCRIKAWSPHQVCGKLQSSASALKTDSNLKITLKK